MIVDSVQSTIFNIVKQIHRYQDPDKLMTSKKEQNLHKSKIWHALVSF
jgi:hypothetical protein